jgi:4-amino-4-deoxy-L-arabinose transferase-like glycosyltransferase
MKRPKKDLTQLGISAEAAELQKKFQEHMFLRFKKGLSHHSWSFWLGFGAFIWSFGVVYVPLTIFLFVNRNLFSEPEKFEAMLALLGSRGVGVAFAILCAVPLAILISLAKHNRIDFNKENTDQLGDYIPTTGMFTDW